MDKDILETSEIHLPPYLFPNERKELFSELRRFPENRNYYLNPAIHTDFLQGDCWKGFKLRDYRGGGLLDVKGIIISNSCDIDPANVTDKPRNVLFAPTIPMTKLAGMLSNTKSMGDIENFISTVRKQEVTSIFYLPPYNDELNESIILLDNIYPMPSSAFCEAVGGEKKIAMLSQYGFYIFLVKLSIHFTRFQEGVHRFTPL